MPTRLLCKEPSTDETKYKLDLPCLKLFPHGGKCPKDKRGQGDRRKAVEGFMVTQKDIDRINELARKSKTEGLTDAEKAEQKELRVKYINGFKASLESQLSGITIVNPDGSKHKVKKKDEAGRS